MLTDEMMEGTAGATADRLEALIQLANEATAALKGELDRLPQPHHASGDSTGGALNRGDSFGRRMSDGIGSLARVITAALPNIRELQQRERVLDLMQSRLRTDVDSHASMVRLFEQEAIKHFNQRLETATDAALERLNEEVGAGRRLVASMRDAEARLNGLSATLTAQTAQTAALAVSNLQARNGASQPDAAPGPSPSTLRTESASDASIPNIAGPSGHAELPPTALLLAIHEELERELHTLSQAAQELQSTARSCGSDTAAREIEFVATTMRDLASGIPTILHVGPRTTTSDPDPDAGPIDLRATAERLVEHYAQREPGSVRIESEIAFDVPALVRGDEPRVRQIIGSLLATSRRLANEGTITLRITAEDLTDDRVALRGEIHHENVDVPPHAIPDLEELESIRDAAPRDSMHRGLGLFVARAVLDSMKGSLQIESENGRSFHLRFTIPVFRHVDRGDPRRSSNRLRLEGVTSSIGPVMDLSRGGARISCVRPPDEKFSLEISDESATVSLDAERVWLNRIGWRRYEVGVRFGHLSAEQSEKLTRLCVQNRVRRTLEEA